MQIILSDTSFKMKQSLGSDLAISIMESKIPKTTTSKNIDNIFHHAHHIPASGHMDSSVPWPSVGQSTCTQSTWIIVLVS